MRRHASAAKLPNKLINDQLHLKSCFSKPCSPLQTGMSSSWSGHNGDEQSLLNTLDPKSCWISDMHTPQDDHLHGLKALPFPEHTEIILFCIKTNLFLP